MSVTLLTGELTSSVVTLTIFFLFSGQRVGPSHWSSAAILPETTELDAASGGRQEAPEQQLWWRCAAGLSALQAGWSSSVPQGLTLGTLCFQSEEPANASILLTGWCRLSRIHRRKSKTLWRHCKNFLFSTLFPAFCSCLISCFHCRGIQRLLAWTFMTTEQTPGKLSTLMHRGRPGKLVCGRDEFT